MWNKTVEMMCHSLAARLCALDLMLQVPEYQSKHHLPTEAEMCWGSQEITEGSIRNSWKEALGKGAASRLQAPPGGHCKAACSLLRPGLWMSECVSGDEQVSEKYAAPFP